MHARGARVVCWTVGVAILSFSTAATVSPAVSTYISELAFAAYQQLLAVLTIVVVASAFPASQLDDVRRRIDRLLGPSKNEPPVTTLRPDRIAWAGALLVMLAAAGLSFFSY